MATHHKEIMVTLDTMIGKYRKDLLFHHNQNDRRKERTKADPWVIWDQVHIHRKNLNILAKERANCQENPSLDSDVAKEYQAVNRAYGQAVTMINQVGLQSSIPKIPS